MLFPTFAQYLIDSFIITTYIPPSTTTPTTTTPSKKSDTDGSVKDFEYKSTETPHDIGLSPLYGRKAEQTTALRHKSNKRGEKGRLKSQMINGEEWPPYLWKADGSFTYKELEVLEVPQGFDHIMQYVVGGQKNPEKAKEDYKRHIFATGGARTNVSTISKALGGTGCERRQQHARCESWSCL
jgi:prostaglandin-endoperoxide synthase 2